MENQYIITTILGFLISGAGLYHFRDTIIRNFGWYFFKLQANVQILTKSKKNESTFELLHNGKNIDLSNRNENTVYDLLIYSKLSDDKINYFTYTFNNFKPFETQSSIDYRFLNCVLNYKDEEYFIKLKTSEYSFYFKNNVILSKSFILWYMKQFHDINVIDDYTITILDHNIVEIILDSKVNLNGIMLCSDGYKILDKSISV